MYTCRDDSALPTTVRPHHRVGMRTSRMRRAADWPVGISDILPSTALREHLLFGLTGSEIRGGVVWMTQRFTPLSGLMPGRTFVAWSEVWRGLRVLQARYSRGNLAALPEAQEKH